MFLKLLVSLLLSLTFIAFLNFLSKLLVLNLLDVQCALFLGYISLKNWYYYKDY